MYDFYDFIWTCVQNAFLKFSRYFSGRNNFLDYSLQGLEDWEFTKPV